MVRNGGPDVWRPEQRWRLTLEASLGANDEENAQHSFSRIVDVALDPLGRVWVADGQEHQIHVFRPDGTHVRSFGRMGGGPDDFNGIAGMSWAADGTLWVLDGGNMRFAVYDTAGRFIATHRRDVNVVVSPWPLGFDRQGSLYDLGSEEGGEHERTKVIRFGAGLQPRDTFLVPAFERPVFEVVQKQGNVTHVSQVTVPFAGLQQWRVDPEGFVWVGVTDRYRLERHRFDGSVDRVVERDVKPGRVSRQQRRRMLEAHGDFERQGGRLDASRIPRTHPVWEDFFFDDAGFLWVFTPHGPGEPQTLDVFHPSGHYLGAVTTSQRLMSSPAPVVRGNRLVGIVQSEDHVESVVVMRLDKPTP